MQQTDQADGFENGSAGEICDDNSLDLHGGFSGGSRPETAARHGRLAAAACNDHGSSTAGHGALWISSSSRWSLALYDTTILRTSTCSSQ